MNVLASKIDSKVLNEYVDRGIRLSKAHPIAAAGIATAAVTALYGLSFVGHYIHQPYPNIRMISIKKQDSSNNKSKPLLVFIHGWPDFADSWGNVINALVNNYDCLLIELPNYNNYNIPLTYLFGQDNNQSTSNPNVNPKANPIPDNVEIKYHISNHKNGIILSGNNSDQVPSTAFNKNPWGWHLPIVIDCIISAINNYVRKYRINNDDDDDDYKVSLIMHDWGSLNGLSLYDRLNKENKKLAQKQKQKFQITRLCTIDIGDTPETMKFDEVMMLLYYQWYNIYTYLTPIGFTFIGNIMGRLLLKTFKFTKMAPMNRLNRLYNGFSNKMNYQYFYFWHNLLYGAFYPLFGIRKYVMFDSTLPNIPLFFAKSDKADLKFRSNWSVKLTERNNENKYKGCFLFKLYPNSSHWVHQENDIDIKQFNQDLLQWLKCTDSQDIVYDGSE